MTSEVNLLEDDFVWWVDSGATLHIYNNKVFLKSMKLANEGIMMYMKNFIIISDQGVGEEELNFTSKNVVTLTDNDQLEIIRSINTKS